MEKRLLAPFTARSWVSLASTPQERAGATPIPHQGPTGDSKATTCSCSEEAAGPLVPTKSGQQSGQQSGLLPLLLDWSLLSLGHKILLVIFFLLAAPEQQLQVSAGVRALRELRAIITSRMQGLEGHMQGDAGEAECEAQPV